MLAASGLLGHKANRFALLMQLPCRSEEKKEGATPVKTVLRQEFVATAPG